MRTSRRIQIGPVLVGLTAAVVALACSSSKPSKCTGDLRCDCYANKTCNAGLVCLSDMCVAAPSGGTGGVVGGNGGDTSVLPGGTGGLIPGMGGSASTPGVGGIPIPPLGTGGSGAGGRTVVSTGGVPSTGGTVSTTGGTPGIDGGAASPYITETDGWASDPAHRVQGALYTYADTGGSIIYPECKSSTKPGGTCFKGTATTTQFCASGTVAQALTSTGYNCQLTSDSCDWSAYWGAALAINLNQPADSGDAVAWDASAYSGVSFDITISAMAANLRLYIDLMDGTQYCYSLSASKTYTLAWSQFRLNCHTTGGAALSGAQLTQIKSFAWQSGTDASVPYAFDFCVDRVKIY